MLAAALFLVTGSQQAAVSCLLLIRGHEKIKINHQRTKIRGDQHTVQTVHRGLIVCPLLHSLHTITMLHSVTSVRVVTKPGHRDNSNRDVIDSEEETIENFDNLDPDSDPE